MFFQQSTMMTRLHFCWIQMKFQQRLSNTICKPVFLLELPLPRYWSSPFRFSSRSEFISLAYPEFYDAAGLVDRVALLLQHISPIWAL
jgi:hypothetical protein